MLVKRIIPCLDVKDGKVVKGVQFVNLKIEGDSAKLAAIYEKQGADELVFLDITASYEKRGTMLDVVKELGAGELLPTSMDYDGTQDGYDLPLTKSMTEATKLPVIASGGAGNLEHIYEVLTAGKADAALAASIFHRSQHSVREVKEYLARKGVSVRLV